VEPPATGDALVSLSVTGSRPARSRVAFRVELARGGPARLEIYDLLGRRVKTVVDATLPAGATDLSWDGRTEGGAPAGSGIYFAALTANGVVRSARVPLLR
jgi:flagellar hook assembly protein FlgD